jgi:hypothetical protein
MKPEIIFVIPWVVGIVWVIRECILYNIAMKRWLRVNHKFAFTVIEKDNLPYVVPNVPPLASED